MRKTPPDPIFANPRLVAIYDAFDGERHDLHHYVSIAKELKAQSVLDIGCGTGCLATLLSDQGFAVTGVDPAGASLYMARKKPGAEKVRWITGDANSAETNRFDLALMTGNVAQVFLSDETWEETLCAVRKALRSNGHFVFEARDPARKAWLDWTPEKTRSRVEVPGIGFVEGFCELTNVTGEFVSFRWTYTFERDGVVLSSDSTLRFRDCGSIVDSLARCGLAMKEIRDAPDRPGKEFVFIAAVT